MDINGSIEKVEDCNNNIENEAREDDVVVIFAGILQLQEIKSHDRKNFKLPIKETETINKVLGVNKNVVVVLQNVSPIEMPWIDKVKAVLETYFSGEVGPEATVRILFGLVNPSGHQSELFEL